MRKIRKTANEWRRQLKPEEYAVCRENGTEPAFSGRYHDCKTTGEYHCTCCGAHLFSSEQKYDSGTGWPSFWRPANRDSVSTSADASHGTVRTEVRCAACDAHLGHVFDDGPAPTHQRYCINSVSLKLKSRP